MAADTRDPSNSVSATGSASSSATSSAEQRQANSAPVAPPNPNVLSAVASQNTAGGKVQEANVIDALRIIRPSEFKDVHTKPCVRDALLTGIGGGFGIGGIRAVWGATVWSCCNWAVGTFVFGSFLMHEFCQRRRELEKQGMKRAVEVIDRKRGEQRRKADGARAAKSRAKKEADTHP